MAAVKPDSKKLFASLDKAELELLNLVSLLSEQELNVIPFENSWTLAQLIAHVTKSNKAITQALNMEGKTTERNPEEREQELKGTFLDFTVKFRSPEFILPRLDIYEKDIIATGLKDSIELLKTTADKVNLSEMISVPVFGEITKLELLYFVLYHTQRHLHQFKNVYRLIHNNNGLIEESGFINN